MLTCYYQEVGGGGGGGGGGGSSRGSNEPPLEVHNGGLKTQTVDFQLLVGGWKTNFECCSF